MSNHWLFKHKLQWVDLPDSLKEAIISHPDMLPPFNRVSGMVFERILISDFGFNSAQILLGDQWGTFYLDDRDYTLFMLRWS